MTDKATTVRAVSIYYGHCIAILRGEKAIEYRSTNLSTGDLVICSCAKDTTWQDYGYSAPKASDLGATIAIVHVDKSVNGDWYLSNVRELVRKPVKGAQSIWRLDASKVQLASAAPIKPSKATTAPVKASKAALPVIAPKDDSALQVTALIARCKALQSTVEIANLVTEARKATVLAYRALQASKR